MPQPTLHIEPPTEDTTEPGTEEHELPRVEAVLAGTLALMTGYSQALQAEIDPEQRLRMGLKIGDNLALLINHPILSLGFRQVICGLRDRWQAMSDCTAQAARDCAPRDPAGVALPAGWLQMPAPKRLQ